MNIKIEQIYSIEDRHKVVFNIPKPKELQNSEFDETITCQLKQLNVPTGTKIKVTLEITLPSGE